MFFALFVAHSACVEHPLSLPKSRVRSRRCGENDGGSARARRTARPARAPHELRAPLTTALPSTPFVSSASLRHSPMPLTVVLTTALIWSRCAAYLLWGPGINGITGSKELAPVRWWSKRGNKREFVAKLKHPLMMVPFVPDALRVQNASIRGVFLFNPAVLPLHWQGPRDRQPGEPAFVVVARMPSRLCDEDLALNVVLAHRLHPKLYEPLSGVAPLKCILRSSLVTCLLDSSFACVAEPRLLPLRPPWHAIRSRLAQGEALNRANVTSASWAWSPAAPVDHFFDYIVGAEDPRLFWDPASRQALVFYSMNSGRRHALRSMWVVNLASVHPPLAKALARRAAGGSRRPWRPWRLWGGPGSAWAPKGFVAPTELVWSNSSSIEKNWMPFSHHGALLLSYSVAPHLILSLDADGTVGRVRYESGSSARRFPQAHALLDSLRLHQSTPASLVHLRESHRSTGRVGRRRYVQIVHTPKTFQHYLVSFLPEPPFEIDAVLPLRSLEAQLRRQVRPKVAHFMYVMSLELLPERTTGSDHGGATADPPSLDGKALIGFGVDDTSAHALTLPIRHLLEGHPALVQS